MYRTLNDNSHDANLKIKLTSLQDVHSYRTRNNQNLVIPRFRKETTKRCIYFQGVDMWNSIPTVIRDTTTYGSFKAKMKSMLLDCI